MRYTLSDSNKSENKIKQLNSSISNFKILKTKLFPRISKFNTGFKLNSHSFHDSKGAAIFGGKCKRFDRNNFLKDSYFSYHVIQRSILRNHHVNRRNIKLCDNIISL